MLRKRYNIFTKRNLLGNLIVIVIFKKEKEQVNILRIHKIFNNILPSAN